MMNNEFYFVPVKTVSEGNIREHWHKAATRHTSQRMAVEAALKGMAIRPPCTVRLVRHGTRALDSDNLQFSFKWIRDSVADMLSPGLQRGRADDDPRIKWDYDQLKVKKGSEGFLIHLSVPSLSHCEHPQGSRGLHECYKALHRLVCARYFGRIYPQIAKKAFSARSVVALSPGLAFDLAA